MSIEEKINLLKKDIKNGKVIPKETFEDLRNNLNNAENKVLLGKVLLLLEKYVYPAKPPTKWELLLFNIVLRENVDPIIEFVIKLDDVKNLTISLKDINQMEKDYENILEYLNNPNLFSETDKERTMREINKKIKIFHNRLETEIDSSFCDFLKKTRLDKGLSLKDIEDMTGISSSHVHRVENGNRKPSIRVIEKLSKALDIPSNQFLEKMNVSLEQRELMEIIEDNQFLVNGKTLSKRENKRLKKHILDFFK